MRSIFCKIVDFIENFFLKLFEKIGLKSLSDFYKSHIEGMRYLVFGGLATIVNIVAFLICEKCFGFSTTICNVIAWITAVIFAYITNKWFVFNSKVESVKKLISEMLSFFGARIFTLIVETIYLNITIDYLGYNSIFMKIISNIIVIILNFVFSKLFIFKKNAEEKKQ